MEPSPESIRIGGNGKLYLTMEDKKMGALVEFGGEGFSFRIFVKFVS